MYKVRLLVSAKTGDGRSWGWFYRDLELPFTPFVGLEIDHTGPDEDPLKVEDVTWDAREGRFECNLEEAGDGGWRRWAEALDYYLNHAWALGDHHAADG